MCSKYNLTWWRMGFKAQPGVQKEISLFSVPVHLIVSVSRQASVTAWDRCRDRSDSFSMSFRLIVTCKHDIIQVLCEFIHFIEKEKNAPNNSLL